MCHMTALWSSGQSAQPSDMASHSKLCFSFNSQTGPQKAVNLMEPRRHLQNKVSSIMSASQALLAKRGGRQTVRVKFWLVHHGINSTMLSQLVYTVADYRIT